jgi:N-acetylglucosamine-6-phosphate deacetylase
MDVLLHAMATIDRACRERPDVSRRIAGIHLEGPYISAEDGPRGAHPREHCRPPCWDEFQRLQRAAGGRIRLVTLSPEYPEAAAFVSRAVASGVVVAMGHTAASGAQIGEAVDAGARLSTHLGNGAHRLLPRHPNYIWNQLADDRLSASLIVDGHHLPADVVRVFVRAKSPGRCILVSDMAAQAGLPPGRYRGGLCEVEILPTGRLVIAGQAELLAGATAPLGTGIARLVADGTASLDEAVRMASHQPAALMGLPCGRFEPGEIADFVVFDLLPLGEQTPAPFCVRQTISGLDTE